MSASRSPAFSVTAAAPAGASCDALMATAAAFVTRVFFRRPPRPTVRGARSPWRRPLGPGLGAAARRGPSL